MTVCINEHYSPSFSLWLTSSMPMDSVSIFLGTILKSVPSGILWWWSSQVPIILVYTDIKSTITWNSNCQYVFSHWNVSFLKPEIMWQAQSSAQYLCKWLNDSFISWILSNNLQYILPIQNSLQIWFNFSPCVFFVSSLSMLVYILFPYISSIR